jgi:hypothetical protein
MIITEKTFRDYISKAGIEITPIANLGIIVGRKLPGVFLLCKDGAIVGEVGTTYFSLEGKYYNFGYDYSTDDAMVLKILKTRGLVAFL